MKAWLNAWCGWVWWQLTRERKSLLWAPFWIDGGISRGINHLVHREKLKREVMDEKTRFS